MKEQRSYYHCFLYSFLGCAPHLRLMGGGLSPLGAYLQCLRQEYSYDAFGQATGGRSFLQIESLKLLPSQNQAWGKRSESKSGNGGSQAFLFRHFFLSSAFSSLNPTQFQQNDCHLAVSHLHPFPTRAPFRVFYAGPPSFQDSSVPCPCPLEAKCQPTPTTPPTTPISPFVYF